MRGDSSFTCICAKTGLIAIPYSASIQCGVFFSKPIRKNVSNLKFDYTICKVLFIHSFFDNFPVNEDEKFV